MRVPIKIAGREIDTEFIILPNLQNNRTLLGVDFLRKAGIVIDLANDSWHFSDTAHVKYRFVKEEDVNFVNIFEEKLPTCDIKLRADEKTQLSSEQSNTLNELLSSHSSIFNSGGEPTEFAEHAIDAGYHSLISVPPCRLPQYKKYLGHVITADGIQTDPQTVRAIMDKKSPANV